MPLSFAANSVSAVDIFPSLKSAFQVSVNRQLVVQTLGHGGVAELTGAPQITCAGMAPRIFAAIRVDMRQESPIFLQSC